MKNLSLFACILIFVCTACDNDNSKNQNEVFTQNISKESPSVNTEQAINLNDGKKWTVDSIMMVHIRAMETDIQAYSQNKETERLSDSLQTHIGRLTASCTMKGQAHDELHKWLLPFIATADSLKEKKGDNSLKKLEAALTRFHMYFN